MLAAFKIRAVPINVNYRYVEAELRYLFDDADLVGARRSTASSPTRVAAVAADAPEAAHLPGRRRRQRRATAPAGTEEYEDGAGRRLTRPAPADGPLRRRHLHRLHRRHHGHAQGRDVAPRGHLLRRHGWRRPVPDGQLHHLGRGAARAASPRSAWSALPTPPFMHVSAHWMAFMHALRRRQDRLPAGRPVRSRRPSGN